MPRDSYKDWQERYNELEDEWDDEWTDEQKCRHLENMRDANGECV